LHQPYSQLPVAQILHSIINQPPEHEMISGHRKSSILFPDLIPGKMVTSY
jgi:hypothetical protein